MTPATRRNIYFPDDLWERITEAAIDESAKRREQVSLSEWVREACEEKLKRQHRRRT